MDRCWAASAPGFGRALLIAALLLTVVVFAPAHAQGLGVVERTAPRQEQGHADDVLILRDGGVQRGSLSGCAGDSCTLAGASVARDNIGWIGLEAEDSSPPGAQDASADAVHLRDGSVHPGRLVGISQYEVVTERGGHPRDEVAWSYLAGKEDTAAAPPGPGKRPGRAEDALILRDGEVRQGELKRCESGSCSFDASLLPRTAIAWIGLQVEDPTPPGVQDPSMDEVHLHDGSVHAGRLLEISEDEVATERRRHPRDAVAWVHLAANRQPISPAPPGSVEHLYDAVVKVDVVERLEYRDSAADIYPPCEIGTAERRVRWTARLPARYRRVDVREIMQTAAKQAEAAGVPQESYSFANGQDAITEVLYSEQNGKTHFALFEERVDQKWFLWGEGRGEGMCTFQGSYRPHTCSHSLTGKPLSVRLGWSPETKKVIVTNGGPKIEVWKGVEWGFQCSASYLNVREFNPSSAPTQFSGSRALFDSVSIEPNAQEIRRLRAGEEVVVRGGVRFKALTDGGVGNGGFARIGAEFDVHATAEIRLTPRR